MNSPAPRAGGRSGGNWVSPLLFFTATALVVAWTILVVDFGFLHPRDPQAIAAARMQAAAIEAVRRERVRLGIALDTEVDRGGSGLIGVAYSPITSTLGDPAAKRAGATAHAAALVVRLMRQAGIHGGETVALNCSGSFPGFCLAAVAACSALEVDPVMTLSVGASSWGANIPEFSIVEIVHAALAAAAFGDIGVEAVALVTPGGADDRGTDLDGAALQQILDRARLLGFPVALPDGSAQAAVTRMTLFRDAGATDLLLTIGGNVAAIGAEPLVAQLSGVITPEEAPDFEGTGLVAAFLHQAKPVIQLLNVRRLYADQALPFDPAAEAPIGRGAAYRGRPSLPLRLLMALPPLPMLLLLARARRHARNRARI